MRILARSFVSLTILWTCCAFIAAFPRTVGAAEVVARIIVVDARLYASLPDADRQEAIQRMLEDIDTIEQDHPTIADDRTAIIFSDPGGQFKVARASSGQSASAVIREMPVFDGMQSGGRRLASDRGLYLKNLYSEAFDTIQRYKRKFASGVNSASIVHLHVFGQGWLFDNQDPKLNASENDILSHCAADLKDKREAWPLDAPLGVEFRPVYGLPGPSLTAQANFISFFVGSAAENDKVRYLGMAGPNCPMGDPKDPPFWHPQQSDAALDCKASASFRKADSQTVPFCVDDLVASVGAKLLREPIRVIVREGPVRIGEARLTAPISMSGSSGSVVIGPATLAPTHQPLSPRGATLDAELVLDPAAGCRSGYVPPQITVETRGTAGTGRITAHVSETPCTRVEVSIGSLTVE